MAIDKTIVEQGLEARGLDSALADNFNFETEDSMNSTLDSFKPRTFENIEDVMKDENLSKMIRTYGDKRLSDFQSKLDKDKNDKKDDKLDKDDKKDSADEPPAWAKQLIEDNQKLKAQNATKEFEGLLNKVGKSEGLSETHISRVKKGLKSDATEADIKAEIASYKKELTELGIKEFGTPGASGGKGNSSIKSAAEAWAKKNKKNK